MKHILFLLSYLIVVALALSVILTTEDAIFRSFFLLGLIVATMLILVAFFSPKNKGGASGVQYD